MILVNLRKKNVFILHILILFRSFNILKSHSFSLSLKHTHTHSFLFVRTSKILFFPRTDLMFVSLLYFKYFKYYIYIFFLSIREITSYYVSINFCFFIRVAIFTTTFWTTTTKNILQTSTKIFTFLPKYYKY